MIVQNLLLAYESYTGANWVYENENVGFSRLYYAIAGDAYFVEGGKKIRIKKNHLYLTPVKKPYSIHVNPDDRLFHTYVHIVTMPPIQRIIEVEVKEGSPLADGVALWRKHIFSKDDKLIMRTVQFVISCLEDVLVQKTSVTEQIRDYIDRLEDYVFNMEKMSHDLGYCREYMTRQFRAEYHVTPAQYFNQRRMNVALEHLQHGARIKEIAEELNYSSAYAFSKAFKKNFGLSPEKYLKYLQDLPKEE